MNQFISHVDFWQWRLAMVGSVLLGIAIFLAVSRVLMIVDRHIRLCAEDWEFEQRRRVKLRSGSTMYRLTEPLIDELCTTRIVRLFNLDRIALALNRGGSPLPWQPAEFAASAIMESLLFLLMPVLLAGGAASPAACVLTGALFASVYLHGAIRSLHQNSDRRLEQIQRRLPCGMDLIALVMQAGAGFRDALKTVVDENKGHPFGEEFRRVLDDIGRGKLLNEALSDLDQRLRCDIVREMVFAIRNSEELGTPLAEIFVRLADQMRQKRSQWAEGAVGRAQVALQGPQLTMMVACMLIVVAPFLFDVLVRSAE